MESVTAGAVIVGIVNGVRLIPQKYFEVNSFVGFLLSLALGLGFGFLGFFGLNLETGVITALAASGLYQFAKKVGGN